METTVQELKSRLDSAENVVVVDVREEYEYEEFNIGSTHIPLAELISRIDEIPATKSEQIVVICRSGGRSGQAQMLLQSLGYTDVVNLKGGLLAWREAFNV